MFGYDEPLQERLRIAATDATTDHEVKEKLRILFKKWAVEYKDTTGLKNVATLHKQFPQRRRPQPAAVHTEAGKKSPSPVGSPTTASAASPPRATSAVAPPRQTASTAFGVFAEDHNYNKHHRKSKSKTKHATFNLEKEKPQLKEALANASVASTNLTNALKRINREKETSSQNSEAVSHIANCKQLRKIILRYIQFVESDQWLGSLIHANEELVSAIQLFEEYNKPIDQDSDSDEDWNMVPERPNSTNVEGISEKLTRAKLHDDDSPPPMPPRPSAAGKGKTVAESEEEDDPNDPFGNQYEIEADEAEGVTW